MESRWSILGAIPVRLHPETPATDSERERIKEKLRGSESRVSPRLVEETRETGEGIRAEKLAAISDALREPSEKEARDEAIRKVEGTRLVTVEQRTWEVETKKIGGGVSAHAVTMTDSNEIFMSQRRALLPATREKSFRHEFDHVSCKFGEEVLVEGNGECAAKHEMRDRWHPTLATYPYAGAAVELLKELAGESPGNSRSVLVGGSEELKARIIEKYCKDSETSANLVIINRLFELLKTTTIRDNQLVFYETAKVYRIIEPLKFKDKMKTIGERWGVTC